MNSVLVLNHYYWPDDVAGKAAMFRHCHEVYMKYFSKNSVMDWWEKGFKKL